MHDRLRGFGGLRRASFEKRRWRSCALSFAAASLVWYAAIDVRAQSSNPSLPTPITGERLASRIEARDIGDARATTHFYTFEARPGDLELQVVSENLNGDVDLFVADDLRPLTKITLLASPTPTRIARTIFLREGATLILRVVARSPGDEAGTYEVTFGGTFQASTRPATDDAAGDAASAPAPQPATGAHSARRTTSSGARIEEPAADVSASAPRVPALPESAAVGDEVTNTVPAPTKSRRVPSVSRAARRRSARAPRPPRTNTPPADTADADANVAAPNGNAGNTASPVEASPDPSPARVRARPAARSRTLADARLVIRMRDGARFERSMIDVERVLVESGELVVLLKSGEERRLSFADVTRFAIEP